jgi:hypothetical protein
MTQIPNSLKSLPEHSAPLISEEAEGGQAKWQIQVEVSDFKTCEQKEERKESPSVGHTHFTNTTTTTTTSFFCIAKRSFITRRTPCGFLLDLLFFGIF